MNDVLTFLTNFGYPLTLALIVALQCITLSLQLENRRRLEELFTETTTHQFEFRIPLEPIELENDISQENTSPYSILKGHFEDDMRGEQTL
jgi:hypothetical protein